MDPLPKLIALIVAALVIHAGVYGGARFYEQRQKQAHARESQKRQTKWTQEDQIRERELKKAVAAKFGGNGVEQAVNDPGVDIMRLLEVLAGHDLPKAAVATVEVDRFTEYSVYLRTISELPAAQRVAYLRQVLSRINPAYLLQVAFVEEDGPTATAEQPCLGEIKDWNRASDAAISKACF